MQGMGDGGMGRVVGGWGEWWGHGVSGGQGVSGGGKG